MSEWSVMGGLFGILLTAIGVLVYARLVHVTGQIEKIWSAIKDITNRCLEHAEKIGSLGGKVNKKD